ncbi:MAG: SAM-dependent methyltransferase [Planctomycetia bacterium]
MAFDTTTRNRLAKFVAEARRVLTEEFSEQLQSLYGISAAGGIAPLERLTHLDAEGLELAATLRQRIAYLTSSSPAAGDATKPAIDRLTREQAFTVLNRLAAIRMAEKRGLIVESVGQQYQSRGFKVFESVAGSAIGDTYDRYRCYLFCLFDELAIDLGSLFDRRSPQALLFPREQPLLALLTLLDDADLQDLWAEDETIGWIYQYYNDPAERKKMREESAAPRNSRELAVRNQFFTPRYVVEFLTDNTLGRIWYEMTQGATALKEQCRYLVRRPTEIFLKPSEAAPEQPTQDSLSQEDLLKQPVFIAHRPLKDPRAILMLDPACGSMHFGLYAFDLFEAIYDEAWEIATGSDAAAKSGEAFAPFCTFAASFANKAAFQREVPRMIVEHNLHGIDIDPRAAQIAGLSLWLRAQRAWHAAGVKPVDRPRITRSNIVCAEPMPGDKVLLAEFVEQQFPEGERAAFGFLLETVFDRMTLAGEAGSLLKIEEEIRTAIAEAKKLWEKEPAFNQRMLFGGENAAEVTQKKLDLSGITDEQFWEGAEERIYGALRDYAEQAESGGFQRRLFAEDAARGFAFIDICKKHYDVVLMNPPFGDASLPSKPYLDETYGDTKGDVYKAFVECFQPRLIPAGYLGIISSRTGFFLGQSENWRTRVVLRLFRPIALADLGSGVLDAMVEVAAYVLRSLSAAEARDLTHSIVPVLEEVARDSQDRFSLPKWQAARGGLKRHQAVAELEHLEAHGFIRRSLGEIVRYSPLWHSVKDVCFPSEPAYPPLVCLRATVDVGKGESLATAVRNPLDRNVFTADPAHFADLPGKPFAYWMPSSLRRVFKHYSVFEAESRRVRQGGVTGNDVKFLRAWWEVGPKDAAPSEIQWVPYAKGGKFSPFYSDIPVVVRWDFIRCTFFSFTGLPHRPSEKPSSADEYFSKGLTWPLRAHRFAPVPLPSNAVFSIRGYAILCDNENELLPLLALGSSSIFDFLFKLALGRSGFPEFVVGILQQLPLPAINDKFSEALAINAYRAWANRRHLDTVLTTSHAFQLPSLVLARGTTLADGAAAWIATVLKSRGILASIQAEIDDIAFQLYGLEAADRTALAFSLTTEITGDAGSAEPQGSEDEEEESAVADTSALVADLLDFGLGCVLGRWDIRYATGEQTTPELPDPFAALPVCPPGQLQNAQGLPAGPEDVPATYPVKNIPWDGILVDDPNHPLDIERRVREVIEIIWNGKSGGPTAEAIELEACEILGVKTLRDYFRKPANFFADHLKRYSKSRRQAPIYWPLSTKSGDYTLWIYYHRLNDQTLHKCLADFLDPKIQDVERELGKLTAKDSGRAADLRDFLNELKDLKDEIERVIKLPWKPNLNDGVLITASPLWKLFRLSKWQKDLKACWEELEKGDYDWAHLAYTIWPERVEKVCERDRSIAIAHGLEHLCKIEPPKPKKPRGKKASS